MRRILTMAAVIALACTGCAGSTWKLDETGLTITNTRTGDVAVLTGNSKAADGSPVHDPHAGVPGCREWLHAMRTNTPGAWGDAWEAYRAAVAEAFRRKRAASGSRSGVESRAHHAFGELE